MNEASPIRQHTFRRFESGDSVWNWPDLTEKIFQADHSYKCPTYVHRTPPCQSGCPSGHDVRGWLSIARGMDKPPVAGMPWQEYAFQRMVAANPFPATMGRACPAPCEDGCNRKEVDDFVGINAVEQYVGDWAIEHKTPLPQPPALGGRRVAVVGGGPGGLAAAVFLRGRGHSVVVFEANNELGGMMRFGIPGYLAPREMLDAEIGRIFALDGVEARTGLRVGREVTIEQLERDFDAVFWAIGAQKGRPLDVPGADAENCVTGVDFLDAFNRGRAAFSARRIVVVGGGNTAIDVVRTAKRLGADEAIIVYRRPREKMPAHKEQTEVALSEGASLQTCVIPLEVIKDEKGRTRAVRMCKCTMNGNASVPIEGSEYVIECDMIVSSIGQAVDFSGGLELLNNGRGAIAVDSAYKVCKMDKHFAGGDVIIPDLLTTAIGHARIAAEAIDHFLAGMPDEKRPKVDVRQFDLLDELRARNLSPTPYDHTQTRGTSEGKFAVHNYEDRGATQVIKHTALFKGHFPFIERSRRNQRHVDADKIRGDFAERIIPLTEDQAKKEGERCMSCGLCFECDNCVIYCPQVAVARVPKKERAIGRYVETDYFKCIGCHICADVCPTGYIQMGLGE